MRVPFPEELFGRLPALQGEIIPPNQVAHAIDPRERLARELEAMIAEMATARQDIARLIGPPESRPPRVPVDPSTLDENRLKLSRLMDRREMNKAQREGRSPDYLLNEDPAVILMQLMGRD